MNFGKMEKNLLKNASNIKQPKRRESIIENADMARLSMKLVSLETNIPGIEDFKNYERKDIDLEKLQKFLTIQGFNSLLSRLPNKSDLSEKNTSTLVLQNTNMKQESKSAAKIDYKMINNKEEFVAFLDKINKKGIVSIDTETTSLNTMEADLVGIALCIEPFEAVYIPLSHKLKKDNEEIIISGQLEKKYVLQKLKPILEDAGIIKIGQNIKFDMTVLHRAANIKA